MPLRLIRPLSFLIGLSLLPAWAAADPLTSGKINMVRSTTSTAKTDPNRLSLRNALLTRDYSAAHLALQAMLARDPFDTDALLALALLERHLGQTDESAQHLQWACRTDPASPSVLSACLGLGGSPPLEAESQLKNMLSTYPGSATIQFHLGNLYARQQRWPEARQAYSQASTGDPDNPDILFNWAISHERLRQPADAAALYRRALQAAQTRPHAFPADVARQRLTALAGD